jgi:hypothetical protein
MAVNSGFVSGRRENFSANKSMAGINPSIRKYRKEIAPVESVLCLIKE